MKLRHVCMSHFLVLLVLFIAGTCDHKNSNNNTAQLFDLTVDVITKLYAK